MQEPGRRAAHLHRERGRLLSPPFRPGRLAGLLALLLLPGIAGAAGSAHIEYAVELEAGQTTAAASIRVIQDTGAVRELELRGAGGTVAELRGPGKLARAGDRWTWRPPAGGGVLRYRVVLDSRRSNGARDAWVTGTFALFRGEDAFPVARLAKERDSQVRSELRVQSPAGWTAVVPYVPDGSGRHAIRNPGTRSSRPMGWIIAGELGTRRDFIGDVEVTVTAPRGLRTERLGMLALLRWTLPTLMKGFPEHPRYVSIVSAGDPFWLGALSAPNSLYVHTNRPLISENGTSTVVHEMAHVLLTPLDTARDADWMDEGLAEYLALRALATTDTISPERYQGTLAEFRRWGREAKTLRGPSATGPVTARSVVIFFELDQELKAGTGGRSDLMDVVRGLMKRRGPVDVSDLRAVSQALLGRPAKSLSVERLRGA